MEPKIQKLVDRLEKIAKKNKDRFRYRIDIEPSFRATTYTFVCSEMADGHDFCSGFGADIETAINNADKDVENCCDAWGYKE